MSDPTKGIPEEVTEALTAYEAAREKIRGRVEMHRRRYRGTKYEDCPPLLAEELAFGVRHSEIVETHARLKHLHGACPTRWAYAVVWFNNTKQEKKSP